MGIFIYPWNAFSIIPIHFLQSQERYQLNVYDSKGKLSGKGEYIHSISSKGLLKAEILIDLEKDITLRQIVELKYNNALQPVRFIFERIEKNFTKFYEINFESNYALRRINKQGRSYEKKDFLKFNHRDTFAGAMFIFVALNFPPNKTELDLNAIVFFPAPKIISVKFRKNSKEYISYGNYQVPAVRYVVRPNLPLLIRLFAENSYNNTIWLSATEHPVFLRFEGFFGPDGQWLRIDSNHSKNYNNYK